VGNSSFVVSYLTGGKLDKLPYPLFPKKKNPKVKGKKLNIPAIIGTYTDTYQVLVDSEYLCIAISCSVYSSGDYWSLNVGGRVVCDTIYVKGLPESIAVGNTMVLVYPIKAGESVTFTYNNSSNIEKDVFYNLHFLE
jgi:hypothetical protein